MKYIYKKLLSLLIVFTMLISFIPVNYSYAAYNFTANANREGNKVVISGTTTSDTNVTLVVVRNTDNDKRYSNEIKSDKQGNYSFNFNIEHGDYTAKLTSNGIYIERDFEIKDPREGIVTVRVEGVDKTLLPEVEVKILDKETTLLEAVEKALKDNKVPYEVSSSMIHSVKNEVGWQWMINGKGGMALPNTPLNKNSEIILVDDEIWNPTITKMTLSSDNVKVDEEFTVTLEKNTGNTYVPAANEEIVFKDEVKNTDADGKVTFKATEEGNQYIICEPKESLIRPVPLLIKVGRTTDVIIPDDNISVNMRIEGYKGTHFDERLRFNPDDYKDKDGMYRITDPDGEEHEFTRPTVLLATIAAWNEDNIKDNEINSNDNYVAKMAGEKEFDFKSQHKTCGWMVRVNDRIINQGVGVWPIDDGDTVEWYYTALDSYFGYIDVDTTNLEIGEKIKVKVTGKANGNGSDIASERGREINIEDATVYVGSKEYTTDSNGEVEIEMNDAGSFDVYAIKLDKSSKHDGHYFPLVSRTEKVSVKVNSPNTLVQKIITEDVKFYSDEYEKLYNEIKDLKKEDTILRKEKNVIDELNKKIDNIKTQKDAQQAVKDISDVSKIAKLCAYKMETEKGGIEAVNNNNTILKSLSKCADKVKDNEYKKEIEDTAIYNIDVITEITDIIKDQKQVDDIYKNMMDNSLELSKQLGKGNNNKLNEKIIDVVNDIVDKKSNITVPDTKIKVQDKYVEATIDSEVMKQIDKISNEINELKNKLKQNGLNKQINSKVTLSISNRSRKRVEVVLESSSIDNIFNKGFDTLRLNTGIATFNITKDTFKDSKNQITLSTSKLNASDINNLENVKIPSSSVIVDLLAKIDDKEVHEFNNINVEIPYDLGDQNKDKLKVFYINEENNSIEFIGGIYDEKSKSIVFETNHFSKYFIKEVKVNFDDLGSVKWAQEAIIAMAEKGIIKGKSGSKFSPNDNITRAEFATLITRMMDYKDDKAILPFKDVSPYGWYYTSVSSAYSNKLINGKSEDTFDPDGNITRQEMAKIIAKVLESKGYKDSDIKQLDMFKDKENIALWAKESISLTVKEKIINGMEDKTFAPDEKATRAQAAVMLYRLYKLINN